MKLGVLFTRNISLKIWVKNGLFEREKLLYEKQIENNIYEEIYWFTYGRDDDVIRDKLVKEKRLDSRIKVIPMPSVFYTSLGCFIYSLLLPYIQKKDLVNINIIKSNQLDGAWPSIMIKKKYKIPFLLRTGYTFTKCEKAYLDVERGVNAFKRKIKIGVYSIIEKSLYRHCDGGVVSSIEDKLYIEKNYGIEEQKIIVVPNYIDTNIFQRNKNVKKNNRVIFVGRLNSIKNLKNTIAGVANEGKGLDIYGEGPLKNELEQFACQNGYDVCFKGVVGNKELPSILNKYDYYVLVSITEGMPKSLLEAMACGVVCIGSDIPGIREVIEDGIDGIISKGLESSDITVAVHKAVILKNKEQIRENAVNKINCFYSLNVIFDNESKIELKLIEEFPKKFNDSCLFR